jgi:hypothetical protein
MTVIRGSTLTKFEVAADGCSVSLNVTDDEARPVSLVLPSDCLGRLVMTAPEMMRQALQRRHRDPSLRLVYPVGEWSIEACGSADVLILTLTTPDGFHMSFAVSPTQLQQMATIASDGKGTALKH